MRGLRNESGTEPLAIGFLAGASFFIFVLLTAVICGSCVRQVKLGAEFRDPTLRADTTVEIRSLCLTVDPFETGSLSFKAGYGSGVIIDSRHVLTAGHVVKCPSVPLVTIVTADGVKYSMAVDKMWADEDVARLEISTALDYFKVAPPVLGQVHMADPVCAVTGYPKRGGNCGPVDAIDNDKVANMRVEGLAWRGNSGSGVWDSNGRLVGILVAGTFDGDKPTGHFYATRIRPYFLSP